MKIKELYEAVAKLGFEDNLEDTSAFFSAANRAMLQINALRPLTAILEIYERVPENVAAVRDFERFEHVGGEDLIIEGKATAKAYYFEALGEGECRIDIYDSDIGEWVMIDSIPFVTASFEKRKGHIKPDGVFTNKPVRLRFIGDYDYSVRCVALFDKVYSSDATKTPELSEYMRYDLNVMCPGFIGLADNPLLPGYERLRGKYFIEDNGVLLVPREYCEDLKIKYKRAPARLVWKNAPTADETEIELDPELSELVPLLTAAYIWADEGDGKYAFYLELYRERAAEIERRHKSRAPAEYKITGGW